MATVTFTFPDDAKDGIVESVATQFGYSSEVPNPEYHTDPDKLPRMIDNPVSKDQFLGQQVMNWLSQIYANWSRTENLKPVQTQIDAAITARVEEVKAATTFEIK